MAIVWVSLRKPWWSPLCLNSIQLNIWADICHISKRYKLGLNVYSDLCERYAEQAGFEHHIEDVCTLKYAWKSPQKYLLSFAFPKGRVKILLRNFISQLYKNKIYTGIFETKNLKHIAGMEPLPFSRLSHLEFVDHSNQIIFKTDSSIIKCFSNF